MNEQPVRAGYRVTTARATETEAVGRCTGLALAAGTGIQLVTLRGDLGAGKTVFVRGLAQGLLGPARHAVASPTYVLQHVHRGESATLYHIDAYRLEGGAEEFEASGLRECLADQSGVVCLEWPEKVEALPLPADRLEVELEHQGGDDRALAIFATGAASGRVIELLTQRVGSSAQIEQFLQATQERRAPPS